MAKCIGCGIKLQSLDEQLPGYVPQLVSDELNEKGISKFFNFSTKSI